jgi:quercetin dioxygenase-like cupin family protein
MVPSTIVLSPDTSDTRHQPEETLKISIAMILIFASSLAFGQSPSVQTWNPQSIVWQRTDSDGTKWAVLEGDKDAPGKAFTYAFFLPAGHWEHHFHNQDARVAVVSGALKVATYPEGSFLYVPANVQHTMGADVDTICIGTAQGPWKTHYEHEMHHH